MAATAHDALPKSHHPSPAQHTFVGRPFFGRDNSQLHVNFHIDTHIHTHPDTDTAVPWGEGSCIAASVCVVYRTRSVGDGLPAQSSAPPHSHHANRALFVTLQNLGFREKSETDCKIFQPSQTTTASATFRHCGMTPRGALPTHPSRLTRTAEWMHGTAIVGLTAAVFSPPCVWGRIFVSLGHSWGRFWAAKTKLCGQNAVYTVRSTLAIAGGGE
jgi:hypothetical protein